MPFQSEGKRFEDRVAEERESDRMRLTIRQYSNLLKSTLAILAEAEALAAQDPAAALEKALTALPALRKFAEPPPRQKTYTAETFKEAVEKGEIRLF